MLNKTTNLKLRLNANTANNSSVVITGAAVPQKFKIGNKQPSYGSTTISSGYITKSYTTTVSVETSGSGTSKEASDWTISSTMP